MIGDLSDIPEVRDYLVRVGARVRSLRTAVIRDREGGYWRDVAIIKLDQDGQITVHGSEGENIENYEPTEHERYIIAIAAKAAIWPQIVAPFSLRDLPVEIKNADKEDIFEFRDDESRITMLQLRVERLGGGKSYWPYTYWTDKRWRQLEPEGLLPLWGIDQLKNYATVFLHEGAKAARTVRRMIAADTPESKKLLAEHPWGEELCHAAHLGWIGGALNPHRTDWTVLHRTGVTRVIIFADNDVPGRAAVPKIAKALAPYPIIVEAIQFDDRFPIGFDLADPFPKDFFK